MSTSYLSVIHEMCTIQARHMRCCNILSDEFNVSHVFKQGVIQSDVIIMNVSGMGFHKNRACRLDSSHIPLPFGLNIHSHSGYLMCDALLDIIICLHMRQQTQEVVIIPTTVYFVFTNAFSFLLVSLACPICLWPTLP